MSYILHRIRHRRYSSSCLKGCKSAGPCFWNLVLLCACVSRFLQIFSDSAPYLWRGLCPDNTCNTNPRPDPERQCGCVLEPSCARTTSITPCQPIQAKSVRREAHLAHTHSGFQRVCAAIALARVTPPPPAPWVATKIVLQPQDWCCEAL